MVVPDYEPESSQAPVNLTTYERIESIDPNQQEIDLNNSMCESPSKKPRANRKMRETRAKSRNYSRYSGKDGEEDEDEKGKIGYEVDLDEMQDKSMVYQVHGEKTGDKVLKKLNDGVREYQHKEEVRKHNKKAKSPRMSPTARLIHLKNKNQRTPTRASAKSQSSGEKSFVEKMRSSEKQVKKDRTTRTTHTYYPKHRIEEEPSLLEQTQ